MVARRTPIPRSYDTQILKITAIAVNDCRLLVTLVSDLPRTMHRECFTFTSLDQCLDSFGSTTLDPHGSTTKLITCQRNIPKYHVVMLVSSCNPNFLPPMPLVGQHEHNLCQVNDLGRTSKSVLIDEIIAWCHTACKVRDLVFPGGSFMDHPPDSEWEWAQ